MIFNCAKNLGRTLEIKLKLIFLLMSQFQIRSSDFLSKLGAARFVDNKNVDRDFVVTVK